MACGFMPAILKLSAGSIKLASVSELGNLMNFEDFKNAQPFITGVSHQFYAFG
jgi:hypothetical protein